MKDSNERKGLEEIEEGFRLLNDPGTGDYAYEERKRRDQEWKRRDPDAYKKDMERMCREMFGNNWQVEYEAMIREEFPEDLAGS